MTYLVILKLVAKFAVVEPAGLLHLAHRVVALGDAAEPDDEPLPAGRPPAPALQAVAAALQGTVQYSPVQHCSPTCSKLSLLSVLCSSQWKGSQSSWPAPPVLYCKAPPSSPPPILAWEVPVCLEEGRMRPG